MYKKGNYKLADYLKIVLHVCPGYCFVNIADRVVRAIVPAVQTLLIAQIIDCFISIFNKEIEYVAIIGWMIALMCTLIYTYLNTTIMNMFNNRYNARIGEKIATDIINKRAALKYEYIEDDAAWNVISRVCKNTDQKIIDGFNNIISALELTLNILLLLVIIWTRLWWIALLIFIVSVPLVTIAYKNGQNTYAAVKAAERHERMSNYLSKVLSERQYVNERTLFQYTDHINELWKGENEIAREMKVKTEMRNFIRMKGSSLITAFLAFGIIGVLLHPLVYGYITVGLYISLSNRVQKIIHMVSWDLSDLIEDLTESKEYLNDLSCFMAMESSEESIQPLKEINYAVNNIVFKNVSFSYPGTERKILDNVSFEMQRGKVYALVGANGAGKSTIIKLLTGLYDNYEGNIYINNRDIKTFQSSELRSLFAVMYQDFARYEIGVKEIMQLGTMRELTDQDIADKLLLAGVSTNEISVDSQLGRIREGALDISGGQWQKIAIAHAILRGASVYVLDEPTASLDPITESNMYSEFQNVAIGDINILITHRLGATKIADEIIVLDNGKILEQGTHEQLMESTGLYADMYNVQKEWYK